MKKLSFLVLAMVMVGVLTGCYTTACQQPPVNLKGEG